MVGLDQRSAESGHDGLDAGLRAEPGSPPEGGQLATVLLGRIVLVVLLAGYALTGRVPVVGGL